MAGGNGEQPRRIIATTAVAAAVVAGFGIAFAASDVLFLLFIGIVVATAIEPAVRALQRRRLPRAAAVTLVYACTVLALAALIVVEVPRLANQIKDLTGDIPRAEQQFQAWLEAHGDALWAKVARRIYEEIAASNGTAKVDQTLTAVSQTASYLATAFHALLIAGGTVLLAFYWSLQGERTVRWLLLLLPRERRDDARATISQIEDKLGAYLRGQGIVCLVMAFMASVVYGLMGLRYALVLGLVAGFLEVLPVLGPILAVIPPLGVAVFTDHGKVLWVLVAATLMQQVESYLLIPRIMDKSLGVHPLATLLGIAAFGSVFGVAGAVLAIPLTAIVQVLLNRYLLDPEALQPPPQSGRGALSVLRYDIQELLRDIRLRQGGETPAAEGAGNDLAEAIEAVAIDLEEQLRRQDEETAEVAV